MYYHHKITKFNRFRKVNGQCPDNEYCVNAQILLFTFIRNEENNRLRIKFSVACKRKLEKLLLFLLYSLNNIFTMASVADHLRRPASASTVATNWSHHTTQSIGHHIPHRHIPVIKGDVNFVNTYETTENSEDNSVSSTYIKEVLQRLSQLTFDSIDHEDALEFIYDIFYMHSPFNQDDSRIARLLIENNYCSIVHQCLIEFLQQGIFSTTSIRRSTQFILYTLWNFTGVNIEFRLHLSTNQKFVRFLLEDFYSYLKTIEIERDLHAIIQNLLQSLISIIHNLTLNLNHFNVNQLFSQLNQLLFEQELNKKTERFRLTIFLCLINLNPKQITQNLDTYQSIMKLLFHFLKKLLQQEIFLLHTGLSAWILANAINKLPIDIVLEDDNRLYSFIILFKRGMREEKLQASLTINRAIEKSAHAKELVEQDSTCWNLFQQFQIFLVE